LYVFAFSFAYGVSPLPGSKVLIGEFQWAFSLIDILRPVNSHLLD